MLCTVAGSGHVSGAHCWKSACACMHIRAHSPLTTPPYASAAAPPPPLHTIAGIHGCRTQCGGCAVCCEGRFAGRAGGRPTGVNIDCKHARWGPRSTAPFAPPPALATVARMPTQTHQAPNHVRGAREGAQRGSRGPGTLCPSAPSAKPRPPAESP